MFVLKDTMKNDLVKGFLMGFYISIKIRNTTIMHWAVKRHKLHEYCMVLVSCIRGHLMDIWWIQILIMSTTQTFNYIKFHFKLSTNPYIC